MRDRLIELLKKTPLCNRDFDLQYSDGTIEKFADYLLANGVIAPPCKVGDVVWLIGNMKIYTKEIICSRKVTSVQMLRTGELIMHFKDGCFSSDSVGVYVFHTKEEAEQALKGGAE